VVEIGSNSNEEFLKCTKYQHFRNLFFKIQDLQLMKIIAIDTTTRIKEIGTTMRFGATTPFNDEMDETRGPYTDI
jgi:hypothetical protein